MTCTSCNGTGRNLGVLWGQSASIICPDCAGDPHHMTMRGFVKALHRQAALGIDPDSPDHFADMDTPPGGDGPARNPNTQRTPLRMPER